MDGPMMGGAIFQYLPIKTYSHQKVVKARKTISAFMLGDLVTISVRLVYELL